MKTSLYSILCVVIRFIAMLAIVKIVASLPLALTSAQQGGDGATFRLAFVGISLIMILLSFAFWLYPGPFARLASSRAGHEVFESPISASQLQEVAITVLGVYFAFEAMLELVDMLLRVGATAHDTEYSFSVLTGSGQWLIAPILRIALGLGLALGARGLSGWLARMRERGPSPTASPRAEAMGPPDDSSTS